MSGVKAHVFSVIVGSFLLSQVDSVMFRIPEWQDDKGLHIKARVVARVVPPG